MASPTQLRWIEELVDARLAENLEREVLDQINDEFGTSGVER